MNLKEFLPTINHRKILAISIALYIAIFSFISLNKFYNYGYNALDLAIINQAFFNTTQGNPLASSIHPPTYLGDHFTPIIFVLLPFYFLFKSPIVLLILQTLVLGACSIFIYLIAKNTINKNWAIIFSLAWLLNPFVQNINLFEFHFLPFAILFILISIYFYTENKFYWFVFFNSLALLTREDVAFVIFMFGVIAFLQKKNIKWILWPVLSSVIYFLLAIKITSLLSPADGYKFLIYYSWLGQTPQEVISTLLTKPWLVLAYFFRPTNLIFLVGLMLPLFFTPLIRSLYLILGLPIFIQFALGQSGASQTVLQTHYSSLMLPALFWSGISSVGYALNNNSKDQFFILLKKHQALFIIIFITAIIYSSFAMGPLPKALAINKNQTNINHLIPQDASVASSYKYLANFSSRENLSSLNYVFIGKQQFLSKEYKLPEETEYLVVDFEDLLTYQLQYGNNDFYQETYNQAKNGWGSILEPYGIIFLSGNTAIYQKNSENSLQAIEIIPEEDLNETSSLSPNIGYIEHSIIGQKLAIKLAIKEGPESLYLKINTPKKIYYSPLGYGILTQFINKKIQVNYQLEQDINSIEIVNIISGGVEIAPNRSTRNIIDEEKIIMKLL